MFANATHTLPRLSPNGQFVAYLADTDSVYNLWLRHVDSGAERQLTFEHSSLKDYHWLPDGSGFAFIVDNAGDENDKLYRFNLETGGCHPISAHNGVKTTILSVDYHHPEAILITSNKRDKALFDVYRYDVAHQTLTCVAENPGDVIEWLADRKLIVRIAKSLTDSGGTLLSLIEHGEYSDLMLGTHADTLDPVEFCADGDLLVLSSVKADTTRLVKMNIFADVETVLFEHLSLDVVDLCTALNGTHVEFAATRLDCTVWHSLDPKANAHIAALNRQVPGDWSVVSRDVTDNTWVIRCEEDAAPVTYYLYHAERHSSNFLFTEHPKLMHHKLAPMQAMSFETRDGLTLHGYFTPAQAGTYGEPAPLMIVVHAGPWARDHWGWNPEVQWLANRGYSVLQVNFRGSTGFGKHLLHAGDHEWGGKMHLDILDAKAWAVDQGLADSERCGVYGFSYGGYEVLVALSMSPDAFACGIALCAPSSLVSLIEAIPPYWKPTLAMLKTRIGDVITQRNFLLQRSPLTHVQHIVAPLLLVQGANDPRVTLHEAQQMVDKMHEEQKSVEFTVFDDEGHGLVNPDNRLRFYEMAEQFLERHLSHEFSVAG